MIQVKKFSCIDESGSPVIVDASFTVHNTDRVAILSRSQESSTILCHALAGILHRTHPLHKIEGSIFYNDRSIEEIDSHERTNSIVYVLPNSDMLISGVKDTVFGEIALSLELIGVEPNVIRARVSHILQQLDIERLADRDPDNLSGGERHKVALASMIIRRPDVLILDNPSMFLDVTGVTNLLNILRNYEGTIIIADPNPYIWSGLSNRFIVIENEHIEVFNSAKTLIGALGNQIIPLELPSWTGLYLKLRDTLELNDEIDSTHCLPALRAVSGALP